METDIGSIISYLFLFFLLLMSYFFGLTETAFSSLNKIRLKNLADKGSKRAQLALDLYDDFDRLLSAVLVGNNISNLSAAAICTLIFVRVFGDIGATFSTVFLTVVVVVFVEVTPKTLAKGAPEQYAMFCAPIINAVIVVLTPVNSFFVWWKTVLVRVFKPAVDEIGITEDELLSIVEEASHSGVIDEEDKKLISNVIEFYDQKTENVLTPRMDIIAISKDAAKDEVAQLFISSGLSRFPVYDKSIDDIIGILHTRDFLRCAMHDDVSLESVITPAIFVSAQMDIGALFNMLQKEKNHMGIVVDEHGGVDGLITMEDILEELMGEIWDESDDVIEAFIPFEENGEMKHRVLCSADTHALFNYFELPHDEVENVRISGWVVSMLGKIPEVGDEFRYGGLVVTVSKTERRRVIECVVAAVEEEGEEGVVG